MKRRSERRTFPQADNVRGGESDGTVDYNLHEMVGIRLVDSSPSDEAAVTRQLGSLPRELAGEPDIVIRFVERLPPSGAMRYLGVDDVGYTDDRFVVLRGAHKTSVRVELPLEQVGGPCEIVCERGVHAVPLLIAVVNFTALAKGLLPLHAAAFTYNGTGVLATGWSKGGKTETLLGFMANGAHYVGDEWVYLARDGRMFGIPEPIKVWDWHLTELPQFRARIGRRSAARMAALRGIERGGRALAEALDGRGARALGRVHRGAGSQRYENVEPERLFGHERCALEGRLDKVLLVISDELPGVRLEEIEPEMVAHRMVFSLEHERLDLRMAYLKYRFAFPDRANPLLDGSEDAHRELLLTALAGREAYVVRHPFPAPIPALFEAIAPVL